MAQAQLVTPPSSKASSSFSKFSPTSSESQTSPSKRGLFNKILRKRSTSSASKKSPLAFTSSASSNSTKVNSITNSERSANVPTSNGSNPRKVHRTGSVRSSRSSKQRSLSEPGIIDDDTASLFDDDADSEDDKDAPANYDSDSSFNSTLSLGHSISIGSIEKSRPAGTLDAPGYDSIYNEKVKFPTLETNNLDNVPTNVPRDEDAPWVGLTYEALIAPKYTRTSKRNKHSPKVLNNLFLAQELNPSEKLDKRSRSKTNEVESPSNGSVSDDETALASDSDSAEPSKDVEDPTLNGSEILVMEFSRDGMFLAAAGHDSNITIWKVISSPLGRLEYKNAERDNKNSSKKSKIRDEAVYTSAPVFHQKPIRVFKGHTNSILTLDWSKNNFLISGSMDRTAKLWHVDREECLKTFQHEDFVTTAKFHPTDDRFFLSGSLDNQARLWSILENNVAFNKNLGDDALITALAFTPDGKYCVVGGFNGSIFVLETKGLYVINRSEIKEKSIVHPFQNKNGNKITGVKIFENPHYKEVEGGDPLQRWTFLITTNDSKVRLVSSTSKKLVTRFKGLTNNSSAIVASMTDDYHYIISGSEDHWCYVWENNNSVINNKVKVAIRDLVTESRHHISDLSHKHKRYAKFIQDNKFVKKVLEDENAPYEFVSNENNSYTAFHAHHSKVNVAIFAPENTKKLLELSDDIIYDLVRRGNACKFKDSDKSGSKNCEKCAVDPRTSAAEDNELTNGHIIVTTDQYGLIRVFRQDSAYKIRKRFVEIYKQGERRNSNHGTNSDISSPLVSVISSNAMNPSLNNPVVSAIKDFPGVGRKISRHGRSLSPNPSEAIFHIKNKLPNRKKLSPSGSSSSQAVVMLPSSSKADSQTSVPTVLSSSSMMNVKHPKTAVGGIFDNDDALRVHREAVAEDAARRASQLELNGSDFTLNVLPYKSKDSALSEAIPGVPVSGNSEYFPKIETEAKVPLIVNTTSENGSNEAEIVHFKTPTSSLHADSFLNEEMDKIKLEPTRQSKHRGRKKHNE